MVAEILAGIALVKSAAEAISSCKDAAKVGEYLSDLIKGTEQVKQEKAKGIVAQKWGSFLSKKLNDDEDDETSISNIAAQKINLAVAEEALVLAKHQISMRWGPDLWIDIIMTRNELIKKNRSAAKKKQEKDKIFWDKALIVTRNVLILFAGVGAIASWIFSRIK